MQYYKLIEPARSAGRRAYPPYSKLAVGATLLSRDDRVFVGCNLENVSLGLAIYAERAAAAGAIAEGQRDFEAIAAITDSKKPGFWCGACRQVLAEF